MPAILGIIFILLGLLGLMIYYLTRPIPPIMEDMGLRNGFIFCVSIGILFLLFGKYFMFVFFVALMARVGQFICAWIAYENFKMVEIINGLYPPEFTKEEKRDLFKQCLKWAPIALFVSTVLYFQTKSEFKKNS